MQNKEELRRFLAQLSETKKLVIVEGKKDESALRMLGVRKIIALNRRPLFSVVEDVAASHKEIIILTDLDAEGKKLYGTLSTALQERGVTVDNHFREFLFRKTKLRQIEGIIQLQEIILL